MTALADACGNYREIVYVLAYGGLRWAEAAGLRKGRVDLLRSRLHIVETISEVNGKLHVVPPKSYARRYVKLPRFVTEALAPLCAGDPDELVFTAQRGGPLRTHFRQSVWLPALRSLDGRVPSNLTPHHLRHTCASILIAHGASVKAVQTQLGHSKPMTTVTSSFALAPS